MVIKLLSRYSYFIAIPFYFSRFSRLNLFSAWNETNLSKQSRSSDTKLMLSRNFISWPKISGSWRVASINNSLVNSFAIRCPLGGVAATVSGRRRRAEGGMTSQPAGLGLPTRRCRPRFITHIRKQTISLTSDTILESRQRSDGATSVARSSII